MILETERLILREMTVEDFEEIAEMLQDAQVMYAYEHAFSDEETEEWIKRQIKRYAEYGFGLWAVILKQNSKLIGQCGITMQECGASLVHEIGYIFNKAYWHMGYAAEAAFACREYAFEKLGIDEVYSIIRENNIPSQKVAKRNKMTKRGMMVKHYYNMNMPHYIYSVRRDEITEG